VSDNVEFIANNSVFTSTVPGNSGSGTITDQVINPGKTLVFKINGISTEPVLSLSNFNATVPGPLPAAGAATAFGYSRRLRRRIQGKRPGGSCPPLQPAHPAAYLNLTTASLKSVPVSFSYASQTIVTDRSNMAA